MKTGNNANREPSPVKGTWPDSKNIMCKDCVYRDKTEVTLGDKVIKVGITKAFCEKYPEPPKSNGKPHEVLFLNYNCQYYRKDKS